MTYWYKDCVKPCGTQAAYQRHRRHGEQPCEPCMAAERERQRKYRVLKPVTPQQAAWNREVLIRELDAYEADHGIA